MPDPELELGWVTIPTQEFERLGAIERAARDLDEHKDQGYASLVSYLIRLHETLVNNPCP